MLSLLAGHTSTAASTPAPLPLACAPCSGGWRRGVGMGTGWGAPMPHLTRLSCQRHCRLQGVPPLLQPSDRPPPPRCIFVLPLLLLRPSPLMIATVTGVTGTGTGIVVVVVVEGGPFLLQRGAAVVSAQHLRNTREPPPRPLHPQHPPPMQFGHPRPYLLRRSHQCQHLLPHWLPRGEFPLLPQPQPRPPLLLLIRRGRRVCTMLRSGAVGAAAAVHAHDVT